MSEELKDIIKEVELWLENVRKDDGSSKNISWAAYHANVCKEKAHSDLSALLPIWRDESKSPAMIKHALDMISLAVNHLNPGQTPVVAFDQPLYAIAKKLQWQYPKGYGEKFVVLMGPLHIEMAFLSTLGDWLEDSGWTTAIGNARIARVGVVQSLVSGHDVARTKYCHQVTACALHMLMHQSHDQVSSPDDFQNRRSKMEEKSPQFQYWSITLKMELHCLLFERSVRIGNFALYKIAPESLLPWIFSLDHYHYARWLSVHLYDMKMLD